MAWSAQKTAERGGRTPADRMWEALAAAGASAAWPIAKALKMAVHDVSRQFTRWEETGLVIRVPAAAGASIHFALVDPAARGARKKPNGQQRMWRAMSVGGAFDLKEISAVAGVSEESAKRYIGVLLKAGYLRLVRGAKRRRGHVASYVMIRWTGGLAPQILKGKKVRDQNKPGLVIDTSAKKQKAGDAG